MKILVITDHFPPDVEGGYELRCEEACYWLLKKKYNYIFRKEVNNFKPDYLYLWRCQGLSRSLIPELFNSQIQTKVDMCDTWLKKVSTEHGPIYGFLQRETESKWKGYLKYIVLKLLPFLSLGYLMFMAQE